jgi:hypothetical protein
MTIMPFEPLIRGNPALLNGDISVQVIDFAEPASPQTIIEINDPWQVKVDWDLNGLAAPAFGGDWEVAAFLEDMEGHTPEPGKVASVTVPLGSVPPAFARHYTTNMTIPKGKVPEGLYKLNVVITYSNMGVRLEMAAFTEGPLLQFYNPGLD